VREYFEHLAILAEHIGLELRDAVRVRDTPEMLEQDRTDTVTLELVAYCERDFCAMRILAANVRLVRRVRSSGDRSRLIPMKRK
jgi:hypothetical protein